MDDPITITLEELTAFSGIGEKLAQRLLAAGYSDAEELASSKPESIVEFVRSYSPRALSLDVATAMIEMARKKVSAPSLEHREPEFEELKVTDAPLAPPPVQRKFVSKSVKIDKFTTKRFRVEVTPSVCDVCGFDVCKRNAKPPYESLSPEDQEVVRGAVQFHKSQVHTADTRPLIAEGEMPKEWLGSRG